MEEDKSHQPHREENEAADAEYKKTARVAREMLPDNQEVFDELERRREQKNKQPRLFS